MHSPSPAAHRAAYYDKSTPAVVVDRLAVTHPAVCSEALRWSTGLRGSVAGAHEMDDVDLSGFATQALVIGAKAISSAGGTQDTFNLEQLVQDVGTRTAESTTQAAQFTARAVAEAAKAMHDASAETKKTLSEAGDVARKSFDESVTTAQADLKKQITQLLGGQDPELVLRLKPLLDDFTTGLTTRAEAHSGELMRKAAQALDPDDPTSPLAKHRTQMEKHHAALAAQVEKQHGQLAAKVDELATAMRVQQSAVDTAATISKVTPLKGATFEDSMHTILQKLATALGDEYVETGRLDGAIARCKKGDGVLTIAGGTARVVLEMSDSIRNGWNDYLDECERNRQAGASLGLVPSAAQNAGQAMRVLGPRRLVMAFDPSSDDASLLRTALQLLRIQAAAAAARQDDSGVQVAGERIAEALDVLTKVDSIRKAAGYIRKNADKIDIEGDSLQGTLNRLLVQARTALDGAREPGTTEATSAGASDAA